jgi:TPR repeat protein
VDELGSLWEKQKMEKTAKLLVTALALWLSAGSLAISAGLLEEQSKYNRAKHIASARTTKVSASPAKARADAMLGFRYEHGLGVPQSFEIAADLYLRAAEQGDPTGQHFLGLMYDKGHGVWQDGILAYKWLNLAAARAPARYREQYLRIRDAAASKLTQDQIYMGQELAIQWVPKPE